MSLKTYDPARVSVSIAGQLLHGFVQGKMIEFSLDTPTWSDEYGVDGEPARWVNLNPFGSLKVFLAQTSGSNITLSNLANGDKVTQAVLLPVLVVDGSNPRDRQPTRLLAVAGWIQGSPSLLWQGDVPVGREWVIRLLNPLTDVREVSAS